MISALDFRPGYPIDLRPDRRVASLQKGPVGDVEYTAGRVIARLTGQSVILQDDGSQEMMPDIRIEYAGRPPGFVEVVTDIDSNYAQSWSVLMKWQGQLPFVKPGSTLRRAWQVTLSGATHPANVDAEIEELLAGLERAGEVFERVAPLHVLQSNPHPSMRRLLELGVVMLGSGPSDPGEIRLIPAGIHGSAIHTWEPVLGWLEQTLASPRLADVRTKLAKTNADERHVFIGVSYTSPSDVFFGLTMDNRTLPAVAPRLPPEITHLWMGHVPSIDRCIAWFPDRGWLDPMLHWRTK